MEEHAKHQGDPDRGERWVNSFAWPDKLIARCFPKFFRRYAPEEIQKQWAAYQERKQRRSG